MRCVRMPLMCISHWFNLHVPALHLRLVRMMSQKSSLEEEILIRRTELRRLRRHIKGLEAEERREYHTHDVWGCDY